MKRIVRFSFGITRLLHRSLGFSSGSGVRSRRAENTPERFFIRRDVPLATVFTRSFLRADHWLDETIANRFSVVLDATFH
ncbi:hypothetical protein QZM22_01035 [Burkholderia oklahomensis]|uniref:hypothetical protein n=1 Tax=Burkholderia oklahomensis TaxID=342113 RepID=UPI00265684B2|nr:hypothetical protein [Burkholderia oklahomensis]MDN7671137.1 hypothetical protein [Burkholderia oklahomensis]